MEHDDLRARMGAADPARHLEPVDPAQARLLIESTVARPAGSHERRTARPSGRRTRMAVAAAVVVLIGGAALALRAGHDAPAVPSAADPTTATRSPSSGGPRHAPGATGGPTSLTGVAVDARCAVPSARLLGLQDLAFAGTLTSTDDSSATFTTSTVYRGTVGDTVVVTRAGSAAGSIGSDGVSGLLDGADLRPGEQYLVSGTGGRLAVCGLSGPATPARTALYEQAYGAH